MGKLKAENPQLFVYYMSWRSCNNHSTKLLTSSQHYLEFLHTIKLDLAKHMLQSLPLDSLPLLCNPC